MAIKPSWQAKFRRGEYHLQQLTPLVQGFLATKPYAAIEEIEGKNGGLTHTWRGVVHQQPPPDWSPIIGECLYDLRSSLDHITWALANERGAYTAFPVCRSESTYKWLTPGRHLKFVRKEAHAFIESLQPYRHVDGPKAHLLALLDRLANDDKHRELLATKVGIARVHVEKPVGQMRDGDELRFDVFGSDYRFQDGTVFIRYWTSNPDVYVPLSLTFDVALNPKGPSAGLPVLNCLATLTVVTWMALRSLEERFFKTTIPHLLDPPKFEGRFVL
jgi:hypothetical protein